MSKKIFVVIVFLIFVIFGAWYFISKTPDRDANQNEESSDAISNQAFVFTNYETGESISVIFGDSNNGIALMTGQGYNNIVFSRAISASGARYVNEQENLVLWNKGNDITLFRGEEQIFTGAALSDQEKLSEYVWVWQGTQMNNEELISPVHKDAFTLTFNSAENVIYATTDCNNFIGPYVLEQDKAITFGDFTSTKKYCEDSQEADFTNMLNNTSHYMFSGAGDLVLLLQYDSGSVIFAKKLSDN